MRQLFVILVALFLGQSINAQPIQPYSQKGYSPAEVKSFALGDSKLATEWRDSMLQIINNGLITCSSNTRVDESNVAWVLDNVRKQKRSYAAGYINSKQDGNEGMKFFSAENPWTGDVWVFNYGNCSIDLYKDTCTNLLKIPVAKAPVTPVQQIVIPATTGTSQPIVINLYNNNIIENSGNSTNTNTNTVSATPATGSTDYVVEQQSWTRPVSYGYDQGYISPTRGMYIDLNFSGGNRGRRNSQQRPVETRTGGYGVSGNNGGNNGGVGGDPRTGGYGVGN